MRPILAVPLATLALLGACAGSAPRSDLAARPQDPAAHTAPGLYLSLADAEAWDRRQRGGVVWVDTTCCGDPDLVVMLAYGVQASKDLGDGVPFFVTGTDARFAARVVDRLARNGARHVYLVSP